MSSTEKENLQQEVVSSKTITEEEEGNDEVGKAAEVTGELYLA